LYNYSYIFTCIISYPEETIAIELQARVDLRATRCWGSQISRQSAHEYRKVVSPTHRPPLPPGNIPRTHFC